MKLRPALLALAVAVAVLAVPAAASAGQVKYVSYQATVEGEADYDYLRTTPDSSRDAHANWTWRSVFPRITFQDDRALTESPDNLGVPTTGDLLSAQATTVSAGTTYSCATTGFDLLQSGRFFDTPYVRGTDPVIRMHLLGGAIPDFDACPSQAAASFDLLGKYADGHHTYETEFTFPREAIGMGKVIQIVDEEVTDRTCPNDLTGTAQTCRLTIHATVTFDKVNEFVVDDAPVEIGEEDIPPVPGTSPEPVAPSGPSGPAPEPDPLEDLFIPLPGGSARLAPSAASATVAVACAADCAGTVTATPAGGKARGAAARALARTRFTARAGKITRVTLRFRAKARRAIRRAGGVRLTIRASAPGRPAARRTVSLKLARG